MLGNSNFLVVRFHFCVFLSNGVALVPELFGQHVGCEVDCEIEPMLVLGDPSEPKNNRSLPNDDAFLRQVVPNTMPEPVVQIRFWVAIDQCKMWWTIGVSGLRAVLFAIILQELNLKQCCAFCPGISWPSIHLTCTLAPGSLASPGVRFCCELFVPLAELGLFC